MIADLSNCSGVYVVSPHVEVPRKKSVSASAIRAALSTNTPGAWASDHRTETDKFTGWHYVGIHSIAVQAFQAEISVYDDNQQQEVAGQSSQTNNPLTAFSQTGPKVDAIENAIPAGQDFVTSKPVFKKDWLKKSRAARRAELKKTWGSKWRSMAAAQNEQAADPLPDDNPCVKLLKNPNPSQSGGTMLYELAQQLELTGSAIIVWIPNGLGNPCEMYVVPTAVAEPRQPTPEMPNGGYWINPAMARRYTPMIDKDGFEDMRGFYRLIGAIVPAEQCVIIRWPHPMWKDDGQSPIAASALWTDTADMADKARWGHLRRGPDPSAAVGLSEEYNPDQPELDRFAANLNNKYGGADKAGGLIVVPHGVTFTELGTNPKDMAYDAAFVQLRDTLLAVHQVPSVAAGITDGGSFAAFVASIRQFVTLKVQPLLSLIAQELTAQIAKVFFSKSFTIEIDASTVDDPAAIEEMLKTDGTFSIRTLNEFRAVRGLPDYDGPEGNQLVGKDAQPAMPGMGDPNDPTGQLGTPGKNAAGFPDGSAGIKAGDDLLSSKKPPGAESSNGDKPTEQGPPPFGDKSRMQWKRNIRAIDDVTNAIADGSYSPAKGLVMLQTLGLPPTLAAALVEDAKDGSADHTEEILGGDDSQDQPPEEDKGRPKFPKGAHRFKSIELDGDRIVWEHDLQLEPIYKTFKKRKLSSTQVNLTGALRRQVLNMGEQIDPRDLATDGIEDDPHITVKYGLLTDDPREVKALLAGANPIQVRFGPLSVFKADESNVQHGGASYDVLKINVESDSLTTLHQHLSDNLDNTTTHPHYQPHVTIAYLKPGKGAKYAEELTNNLEDQSASFNRLVFSDSDKNHSYLQLGVKALPAAAKANGHRKSLDLEERDRRHWLAGVLNTLASAGVIKTYDPSEERDGSGKWTAGGGGGGGSGLHQDEIDEMVKQRMGKHDTSGWHQDEIDNLEARYEKEITGGSGNGEHTSGANKQDIHPSAGLNPDTSTIHDTEHETGGKPPATNAEHTSMDSVREPERIAHKIADRIINDYAKGGYTTDHPDFRAKWGDLEDGDKIAVVKELANRGMVDATLARKRTPVTASTVLDSMRGTARKHLDDHTAVPTNRHIPFTESDAYQKATKPPQATETPATASGGTKATQTSPEPKTPSKAAPTSFKGNALSREVATVERKYPPANTSAAFSLDRHRTAEGTFTPARAKLHDKITSEVLGKHEPAHLKTYTLMGGGTAAGKSTILNMGLVSLPPDHVSIDSDTIKSKLPEAGPMQRVDDKRWAAYLHEESSYLAKRAQAESFNKGYNTVLDGTGNASVDSVTAKINKARDAGYRVEGEYVTCSIESALERSAQRANDPKHNGRMVDPNVLINSHKSVSNILPQVAGKFDKVRLWDSENLDSGKKPTLVMSAEHGKMTIHDGHLWEMFKDKASWQPKS
jgi:predicted ABC-type ATPase/2'-5' RNA ligase